MLLRIQTLTLLLTQKHQNSNMEPARCPSRLDEYYQKFLELQNKLKKSEEQRFLLEMKFNETVQMAKEEEQAHYRKLRAQYKRFLEEDKKRQDRNERIIRHLERIETRIAMLSAKTERINMLRRQYQSLLMPNQPTKHHLLNELGQPGRQLDVERPIEQASSHEETIQILDKYLENISSQRCRQQEEEAQKQRYWQSEELKTNRAASLADGIMSSICSRHYNRSTTPGMVGGEFTCSKPSSDGFEQAKLPEVPVKRVSLGQVEAEAIPPVDLPKFEQDRREAPVEVQQEIAVSPLNQPEVPMEESSEANETGELQLPKPDVYPLPQTEPLSDQTSRENDQQADNSLLAEDQDPIAAKEPDYPPQQEVETEDPMVANPSDLDEQNNEAEENPTLYDPNDQQHYEEMAGYDQYGQVLLYDQHGQPVPPQYDETGQIVPQYDANGQPVTLYDQTGQQYDQNRQPVMHYDANGQLVYEYYGGEELGGPQYDEELQYGAAGDQQSSETQRLVDCGDPGLNHEGPYFTTEQPNEHQLEGQLGLTSEDPGLEEYEAHDQNQEDYYAGGYQPGESQLQLDDEGFRGQEPGGNEEAGEHYSGAQQLEPQPDKQAFAADQYDQSQPPVENWVGQNDGNPGNCMQPIEDDNGGTKDEEPEEKAESQREEQQDEEQPVANVMDILDTDTESAQQNISKVSNDTDFDFS